MKGCSKKILFFICHFVFYVLISYSKMFAKFGSQNPHSYIKTGNKTKKTISFSEFKCEYSLGTCSPSNTGAKEHFNTSRRSTCSIYFLSIVCHPSTNPFFPSSIFQRRLPFFTCLHFSLHFINLCCNIKALGS